MNLIKKGLLYIFTPILAGCSFNLYNQRPDPIYEPEAEIRVYTPKEKKNIESRFDWAKSAYKTSWGWDFDGDGIINWDDLWPYRYGPFVDMNGNGITDPMDLQVDGFISSSISSYPMYWDFRWIDNRPIMDRRHYPVKKEYFHKKYKNKKQLYHKIRRSNTYKPIDQNKERQRDDYVKPRKDEPTRLRPNYIEPRKKVKKKSTYVPPKTNTHRRYIKPKTQKRSTYNRSNTNTNTNTRREVPKKIINKKPPVKKIDTRRR